MTVIPQVKDFADQMQIELEANSYKGDFRDWHNLNEMLWEFEYHKGKLLIAIKEQDKPKIKEYIADCANILMFMGNTLNVYKKNNN